MLFGKQNPRHKSRMCGLYPTMGKVVVQLFPELDLFLGTISKHAMTRRDSIRHKFNPMVGGPRRWQTCRDVRQEDTDISIDDGLDDIGNDAFDGG